MSESVSSSVTRRHDDEIDLQKLFGLLLDHWLQIVVIALIVLLLGGIYAFTSTPIYRADAMLQLEKKKGGLPGFDDLSKLLEQDSPLTGEIQILRSRMVLGEAVDGLGMAVQLSRPALPLIGRWSKPILPGLNEAPFGSLVGGGTDIRVREFLVPTRLEGVVFELRARNGGFALFQGGTLLLEGKAGESVQSEDGAVRLTLDRFILAEGDKVNLVRRSRLSQINALRAGLAVSEQGRNSGILSLSFTGPSSLRNRAILDAIADAYLMQNIRRLSAEAEKSLEFLERQLPEIRANLEAAEESLNQFRLESGSVDLSVETQQVLSRLVTLEAKENELQFQEKELSALYTREHPTYRTLIMQQQTVRDEKGRLAEQVRSLPETQQEVLRLTRDVQVNQEIYLQMLNRSQELRVVRAGTIGNVRIIDRAESLPRPIKPKKLLILALSLGLGVLAGCGWVLLRAAFRHGVESAAQVEETGLPVYAAIPLSEQQGRITQQLFQKEGGAGGQHALLAQQEPTDQAVEALRSLRTSLHFAMMGSDNHVLMVSGPSPEVGKSFVSANLAYVLSQIDRRVLLIDGDMRKGHLHRYFNLNADTGLSSFLSGQHTLEQVIHRAVFPNLDFIARGDVPPNPAELLMHDRFGELVSKVSADYDLVIIDSPPVLAVTDAAIIGQYAGTSLIVARFAKNTVSELNLCRQRFEQNGVQIKGAILNCMERRARNSYGYYGYYNYTYK